LGEPIVPLILTELEREPNVFWFTVLAAITGQNPVPPAVSGQVEAMAVPGSIGGDSEGIQLERGTRGGLPQPRR
jgi:hypothetical protein